MTIYGRDTYSSIVLENIRENTAQKIQILKRAQSDYFKGGANVTLV